MFRNSLSIWTLSKDIKQRKERLGIRNIIYFCWKTHCYAKNGMGKFTQDEWLLFADFTSETGWKQNRSFRQFCFVKFSTLSETKTEIRLLASENLKPRQNWNKKLSLPDSTIISFIKQVYLLHIMTCIHLSWLTKDSFHKVNFTFHPFQNKVFPRKLI